MSQKKLERGDSGSDEGGPVECLGITSETHDVRREYSLEKLREKLKDPKFRKIPEKVLKEDEKLLMYYDVASTRLGED